MDRRRRGKGIAGGIIGRTGVPVGEHNSSVREHLIIQKSSVCTVSVFINIVVMRPFLGGRLWTHTVKLGDEAIAPT
jgi:hypothetical protein